MAQLNGKAPKFLKKGLNGLADGLWAERQITELAGAAATMFLSDGSTKKSKRLFSASMIDPTANSLAQAEWASQAINESFVPEAKLKDFAKEAVHLHAFEAGKFRDALTAARDWIEEEPFSMRAHVAAVSAAMLADEYELTVELAVAGKKHAPHSLALGNAEAFGLARCGRLDEAEAALRPVLHRSKGEQVHMSVAKANGALVAMRRGNLAIGENMYRQVIDEFAARGELSMKCSAAAYFAQEAIQARHPQAREILAEADQMIRDAKTKRPGFKDPISEQALKTANSLANSHLAANN